VKQELKNENDLAALLWSNAVESKSLQKALLELSLVEQRMLFLRFWEPMTIEEIAKEMRMTWGEVDKGIDAALAALRERLIPSRSKNQIARGAA